ncbi:MAG: hypothetical protein ABW136_07630 [Steroidobacteraceae bacterium]
MSNRRELLQLGMAAIALPLGRAARAARSQGAPRVVAPVELHKAVYDTRFAASRAFGERMTAHGIATASTAGDVTALWYDSLHAQWQKAAAPIAGLTARGPLFCLERLAWDYGMRVIFRAEHSSSSDGMIRHDIEGAGVPDAFQRLATDANWVSVVSDVMVRYPHSGAQQTGVRFDTLRPALQLPEGEPLYSWVIAPALRG